MDIKCIISVSEAFSITPGSRYRSEGPFSGEEFRETILKTKFKEAIEENKKMIVNLDGTLGYGTSFLEEAFGGLARSYDPQKVLEHVEIVSTEEPYLKDDVIEYIKKANG